MGVVRACRSVRRPNFTRVFLQDCVPPHGSSDQCQRLSSLSRVAVEGIGRGRPDGAAWFETGPVVAHAGSGVTRTPTQPWPLGW